MKSHDWRETLLSQYANSPIITALIETFDSAVDPETQISDWYAAVWDVATARGWGLDVWGRIVGVTRYLLVSDGAWLGFSSAASDPTIFPFGFGVLWSGTPDSSNFALTDEAFRVLILAKALANISRTDIPATNRILMLLFPDRGNAYVQDLGNMQMQFMFEFALEPFEKAIVKQSGALPHPTGVGVTATSVPLPGTFGFHTPGYTDRYAPFGQGTFYSGGF